jgi:hypothetical protein
MGLVNDPRRSFSKDQLRELRNLMTAEAPETELSAQILGAPATIVWIDSILKEAEAKLPGRHQGSRL